MNVIVWAFRWSLNVFFSGRGSIQLVLSSFQNAQIVIDTLKHTHTHAAPTHTHTHTHTHATPTHTPHTPPPHHTHTHSHTRRLRKLTKELERSDNEKRDEIAVLKKELERRDREIKNLTQNITELKDVLQQSVKPGPKTRPEHRMGECGEGGVVHSGMKISILSLAELCWVIFNVDLAATNE